MIVYQQKTTVPHSAISNTSNELSENGLPLRKLERQQVVDYFPSFQVWANMIFKRGGFLYQILLHKIPQTIKFTQGMEWWTTSGYHSISGMDLRIVS